MRRASLCLALVYLFAPFCARAQQQQPSQPPASASSAQPAAQQDKDQDSVADAARKNRTEKKASPKSAKVFDNDNIPKSPGSVSVIGSASESHAAQNEEKAEDKSNSRDESYWRERFHKLYVKKRQAEEERDILQRELSQLQVQYYPDPNVALQQQYSRSDINQKLSKLDTKKREIEVLDQQIADLQDELRRAGGDPGWARE
ncbi:MAG: hypothetical protein ACRD50_11375 [Candidatus Acidiferrales bacterium]